MNNPISSGMRGWLYVAGIAIGILATAAGPLEIALHVSADWQAVVTSAVGAVGTLVATLSRANLTPDGAAPAAAPAAVTVAPSAVAPAQAATPGA